MNTAYRMELFVIQDVPETEGWCMGGSGCVRGMVAQGKRQPSQEASIL